MAYHICFLTIDFHNDVKGGGIGSYLLTLSQELVDRGHRVTIITISNRNEVIIENEVRIIFTATKNFHWYVYKLAFFARSWTLPIRELEWSFALWKSFRALHSEDPVDIIESTEIGNFFYRSKHDPPLVIRAHGDDWTIQIVEGRRTIGGWINHKLSLYSINRAAALSAVSQSQAERYQNWLRNNQFPIRVIYNPISPLMLETEHIDKPVSKIVLFTARLEKRKGILVLLKAIPKVLSVIPETIFLIAGRRHPSLNDTKIQETIGDLYYDKRVRFLGHVAWQEIQNYYQQAHIFVMPSLYEPFGISALEAMAYQLPVIASETGGLTEIVEDGRTGVFIETGNSEALASTIIKLLQNPEKVEKMGKQGYERVNNLFTVDKIADQTINFYTDVITNNFS